MEYRALTELYGSLRARKRPEDVAQLVLEALSGSLDKRELSLLESAAKGSLKRMAFAYTSMLQTFRPPVGAGKQVAKARELFTTAYALDEQQCSDPAAVEAFLRHIGPEIRKAFGESDFKDDRLNREQRAEAGLDLSRRRYNKLFRLHARLEAKLHTLRREEKKFEFTLVGKSGLASRLTWEEFSADTDTACFIAYYTARCNLRSEFTISGQQKPYDRIAEMLLARCRRSETANWWAIAHSYPAPEVFAHLTDAQKGELLGRWYGLLQDIGALLREVWNASDIVRETMIVRRGNDSSTWNNTASAWNKARDNWIGLLYALGMEYVLETVCPGKALRLMAADVAAWHRLSGGGLDPNTLVWRELPLPWEVLFGEATCTRRQIIQVCANHGMDPEKTGWTAPRPRNTVAEFRPTPELVHGVTVSSPFLAKLLRDAGVFSGKTFKPEKLYAGQ